MSDSERYNFLFKEFGMYLAKVFGGRVNTTSSFYEESFKKISELYPIEVLFEDPDSIRNNFSNYKDYISNMVSRPASTIFNLKLKFNTIFRKEDLERFKEIVGRWCYACTKTACKTSSVIFNNVYYNLFDYHSNQSLDLNNFISSDIIKEYPFEKKQKSIWLEQIYKKLNNVDSVPGILVEPESEPEPDFLQESKEELIEDTTKTQELDTKTSEIEDTKEQEKPMSSNNEAAAIADFADVVAGRLKEECNRKLDDYIKNTFGYKPQIIEIKHANEIIFKGSGLYHKSFDKVVKLISCNIPVYLNGDAGSGKNVLCQQVAESLNLKFYYSGAVQQEYGIRGFTDANGIYRDSEFYKAFTQGGLFMLDEMDASSPDVLVLLNGAIANGFFDFPSPIGCKQAHPDFRVVGAGNTAGYGANDMYTGRQVLDAATLDRFMYVDVKYDEDIERAMAQGDEELVSFAHDLRDSAKRAGVQLVVSYRGIKNFKTAYDILGDKDAMVACFLKGIDKADVQTVAKNLEDEKNKYSQLLIQTVPMLLRA